MRAPKRRVVPVLGACALLTGGIGTLAAGTADAAVCAGPVPAGTSCTVTGTLIITSGSMTLTSPTALGWSETVNGLDQHLVDPTVAHQSYLVNDATGTAPGWHVTIAATQFTTAGGTPSTLSLAGTFATNGSLGLMTDTTAPTAACSSESTCTVPTDGTTYPVAITTGAADPVSIYDAAASTGAGMITVGAPGADPVGWWLSVPSNTIQGTYTSTITLELITGP
jgi:WxL domain surface cell wall-binding